MYTRLQRLGVSVSHKSALRSIKDMGINFMDEVLEWREKASSTPQKSGYILVGDNLDKHIKPRDMRIDHQSKSIHYFHSYAALNRIDVSGASIKEPQVDLEQLPLSTFLPSTSDCVALKENYTVLVARIITKEIPFLHSFKKCVPQHIEHRYSEKMKQKSVTVRDN